MALPVKDKTYTFSVDNQTGPSSGNVNLDEATQFLKWKNALKTLGCTIAGSSDGHTAGMDGVDRWDTADTVNDWALTSSQPRSWIVIQFPNPEFPIQILLDLQENTTQFAKTGAASLYAGYNYTGGTTTAKPTATNEITIGYCAYLTSIGDALFSGNVAAFCSTDNEVLRTFFFSGGVCAWYFAVEKIKNPVSGHSDPWVITQMPGEPTAVALGSTVRSWSYDSSTQFRLYHDTEGLNTSYLSQIQDAADPFDSTWPLTPVGWSSLTAGFEGAWGDAFDVYFGSVTPAAGDTYPNDTTRTWLHAGDIVVPWDGSSPIVV